MPNIQVSIPQAQLSVIVGIIMLLKTYLKFTYGVSEE